jgi:hypothetical protein
VALTAWRLVTFQMLMLVMSAAAPALAYRPFNGTDAAVASRGELEIELGPMGYLSEGSMRSLIAPGIILNWGFSSRWEVVLEGKQFLPLDAERGEPRHRIEDTALLLKGVLHEGSLQGERGWSVAAETGVLLPTLRGESGAGALAALVVSRQWKPLTLHLNAAGALTRAHKLGLAGSVILEGASAWRVRPVIEALLEREAAQPELRSGLVGVIWRASEALSLDAGFRVAREGALTARELRAGLTWKLTLRRSP